MRRLLRWLVPLGAALVATAAFAGAVGDGRSAQADPIIIGRDIALTGWLSAYDKPAGDGILTYVKEINRKGGWNGRQLKVITQDNKTDGGLAGTAANELLSKGAQILIVSCDYERGAPPGQIAAQKNVIAFSLCAGSLKFGPAGVGKTAFTIGTAATTYAASIAEWAFNDKKWKNAYLLFDNTHSYTQEICDSFKSRWTSLGGKHKLDTFKQTDSAIPTQITRLKAAKTDFVFVCSYMPGQASVVRQIRTAGINLPILSDAGYDGETWKKAVPNASNIFFSGEASIYGDDPNPAVNAYFKRYPTKAPSFPVRGYAIMEVLAGAYKKVKSTDGAKLTKAIEENKKFPTLLGPVSFTSKFHIDLYRPMKIFEIQKGKTRYLKTVKPKQVPITVKVG